MERLLADIRVALRHCCFSLSAWSLRCCRRGARVAWIQRACSRRSERHPSRVSVSHEYRFSFGYLLLFRFGMRRVGGSLCLVEVAHASPRRPEVGYSVIGGRRPHRSSRAGDRDARSGAGADRRRAALRGKDPRRTSSPAIAGRSSWRREGGWPHRHAALGPGRSGTTQRLGMRITRILTDSTDPLPVRDVSARNEPNW
jgi:hypothetical protein